MPKTLYVFPGLDALFQSSVFPRWLHDTQVQSALAEASTHLGHRTRDRENLVEFLRTNSRPHLNDFDRMLVALTAVQIGIARSLMNSYAFDEAVSCSHGDIARNVVNESLTFEAAVDILYEFSKIRKECPTGSTANIRTLDLSPLTPSQIEWIGKQGLSLSRWSASHGTVSADRVTLNRASESCRNECLKIKSILPYPVHSEAMRPVADHFVKQYARWTIRKPKVPVFSTVLLRSLTEADEILDEAYRCVTQPIHWFDAVSILQEREDIERILSVGPSQVLTNWALQNSKKSRKVIDSWTALQSQEAT